MIPVLVLMCYSISQTNGYEVKFADGSNIVCGLKTKEFELKTKYGILSIPSSDVSNIDFGLRIPDKVSKEIDLLLLQLGSKEFKDREKSQEKLVSFGHFAFHILKDHKSQDPEVVTRVDNALRKIEESVSAQFLMMSRDDQVSTKEFLVRGKIQLQKITLSNENFGDLDVDVSKLNSIRSMSGDSIYKVEANSPWKKTVNAEVNVRLEISVKGEIDLWTQTPGQHVAKASGLGTASTLVEMANGTKLTFPSGALIGKIGENGNPFLIGTECELNPGESGSLYLYIVPSPWNNNSVGSYQVKIKSSPRKKSNG